MGAWGRLWRAQVLCATSVALAVVLWHSAPAAAASDRGLITYDTADGIFAVHADGSDSHLLIARRGARGLRWSPNGRRVVYTQYRETRDRNGASVYHDPHVVLASTTGAQRRVIAAGSSPRWTPDGRSILFASSCDCEVSIGGPAPNTALSRIKKYDVATGKISDFGIYGSPYSLSPDLTRIVGPSQQSFAPFDPSAPPQPPDKHYWYITTIASGAKRPLNLPRNPFWGGQPMQWLPNGLLAWNCHRWNQGDADLCLMNPKTNHWRQLGLPYIFEIQIAFSPSGHLAVVAGNGGIYTINAKGSRPIHFLARNPSTNGTDNPDSPDWQQG